MELGKTNGKDRGAHDVSLRSMHLESIVDQHETALLRYAGRIVNDATAAQDVVQNVFIKLFRRWDGHVPEGNTKAWLYRVAHNEAVDHVRRESRLSVLHIRQGEEADVMATPQSAPQTEDRKREVLRYLGRLEPAERQVVLLRLQEGFSYKEIAEISGRSVGNVGNLLHHAVKKLSKAVRQNGLS